MTDEEQKATLAFAVHATFADGLKDDRESEEVRDIATAIGDQSRPRDLATLYQDVMLKRLLLAATTAALADAGQRQFAYYEIALCACEADGRLADAERGFLEELKRLLALPATETDLIKVEVDVIIDQTEFVPPKPMAVANSAATVPPQASAADLDKSILNYAVLNGTRPSMAAVPLQIKMAYGIGKSHGVELDQGHIKEFIAAAGIGMAFAFASTYAHGQVAKRYHAGGRSMSTALLRETFQNLLDTEPDHGARARLREPT